MGNRMSIARVISLSLIAGGLIAGSAAALAQGTPAASPPPALDLAGFRDTVQPLFLDKKPGFARCYVCHSQGTTFRLQRLPEGRTAYNEEETRKNLEAVRRLISPGQPDASRLLLMPLLHEAGGTEFHPGGKRWAAKTDPEWQRIAGWVKSAAK
jgi:hypothetical protein